MICSIFDPNLIKMLGLWFFQHWLMEVQNEKYSDIWVNSCWTNELKLVLTWCLHWAACIKHPVLDSFGEVDFHWQFHVCRLPKCRQCTNTNTIIQLQQQFDHDLTKRGRHSNKLKTLPFNNKLVRRWPMFLLFFGLTLWGCFLLWGFSDTFLSFSFWWIFLLKRVLTYLKKIDEKARTQKKYI